METTEVLQELSYAEKLVIANNYLSGLFGLSWDDLADINSLHDAETKEDVIFLCEARIDDI